MTEEQAYEKLQTLLSDVDDLVGEHYGAVEIIKELMQHFDIDVSALE